MSYYPTPASGVLPWTTQVKKKKRFLDPEAKEGRNNLKWRNTQTPDADKNWASVFLAHKMGIILTLSSRVSVLKISRAQLGKCGTQCGPYRGGEGPVGSGKDPEAGKDSSFRLEISFALGGRRLLHQGLGLGVGHLQSSAMCLVCSEVNQETKADRKMADHQPASSNTWQMANVPWKQRRPTEIRQSPDLITEGNSTLAPSTLSSDSVTILTLDWHLTLGTVLPPSWLWTEFCSSHPSPYSGPMGSGWDCRQFCETHFLSWGRGGTDINYCKSRMSLPHLPRARSGEYWQW